MKEAILFMGVLFCTLMTMPSYGQKISKGQKENNIKTRRIERKKSPRMMEVRTQKEIKQINKLPYLEEVPERVSHEGYIDPITGHWVSTTPNPINENDISIISPGSDHSVRYPFYIMGETKKNSRVKVLMTAQSIIPGDDEYYTTTIYVESDNDGKWKTEALHKPRNIDFAYSKIPFKITAVRIHAERGNTAAVNVFYNPEKRPQSAGQSNGN